MKICIKLTRSINWDNLKPNLTKTVSVLLLTGRMSRLYVLKRSSYNRLASGLHSVTRKYWNTRKSIKLPPNLFIFHNKKSLLYCCKKFFSHNVISFLAIFHRSLFWLKQKCPTQNEKEWQKSKSRTKFNNISYNKNIKKFLEQFITTMSRNWYWANLFSWKFGQNGAPFSVPSAFQ